MSPYISPARHLAVFRFIALVLCALFFSSVAQAAGIKIKDYQVDRFTDTGTKDSDGNPIVRWEQGTLYVEQGFIPITAADHSASTFKLDAATLSAINGKFVDQLATWVGLTNIPNADYSSFQRSAETYSIDGVPNVIVSLKGSGGGGGGNTPAGAKPTVSVSVATSGASEAGPTSGRFLIALDSAKSKDIRVFYSVSGKAKNGKDYVKIAKNVLIPAGNVSAYLEIVPIDDAVVEGSETAKLKLLKKPAYKLGSSKSATVTIQDND